MILYLIVLSILALLSLGKIKNSEEEKILLISIIFFWFLATFRSYEIGNDTKNYFYLFKSIANTGAYTAWRGRYEVGYLLMNQIIGGITSNFTIFLAFINAGIYYAYYKFIKNYSENKILTLFLFMTLGFWGQTVNVIRLQIATALSLIAYMEKDKKNRILAIGFSVLAFSFQRISIVYLGAWFVPKKFNKKFYMISTIIGVIAYMVLEKIFQIVASIIPYFSNYLHNSTYVIGDVKIATVLGIFMRLSVFIFGVIVYKNRKKCMDEVSNEIVAKQINMLFIALITMIMSLKFNLLDRCSNFYWLIAIVLIPNIIRWIPSMKNKLYIKIIIIIVCISYFLIVNIYRPSWNHIYPYKMIFNK